MCLAEEISGQESAGASSEKAALRVKEISTKGRSPQLRQPSESQHRGTDITRALGGQAISPAHSRTWHHCLYGAGLEDMKDARLRGSRRS